MEDTTGGEMIHAMAHTYMGELAMNSDNFTEMIPGMIDVIRIYLIIYLLIIN
jgi:hypothetical protein